MTYADRPLVARVMFRRLRSNGADAAVIDKALSLRGEEFREASQVLDDALLKDGEGGPIMDAFQQLLTMLPQILEAIKSILDMFNKT